MVNGVMKMINGVVLLKKMIMISLQHLHLPLLQELLLQLLQQELLLKLLQQQLLQLQLLQQLLLQQQLQLLQILQNQLFVLLTGNNVVVYIIQDQTVVKILTLFVLSLMNSSLNVCHHTSIYINK